MKRIMIAIGFLAAASAMMLTAQPALAAMTPEWAQCEEALENGSGQWSTSSCNSTSGELNWETRAVSATREMTSSGTVEVTDKKAEGGELTVKCKETDAGWIGREGLDKESSVTLSSCTRVAGTCEEKELKVKAIDLPWNTQLAEKEGKIRDLIKAGGGGPGYTIECGKKTIECTGAVTMAMSDSSGGEVQAEFDKTSEAEKGTCSVGGAESERVHGTIDIKAPTALVVTEGKAGGGQSVHLLPESRELKFKKLGGEKGSITILNTGDQWVELEKQELTGAEPAGFKIVDNSNCLNQTLRGFRWILFSGGSCTLQIELVMAAAKAAMYKGQLLYEDGTKRDFIIDLSNP